MAWQYHPLLVLFFLAGLLALGVAGYCWHLHRRNGFTYLVSSVGLLGVSTAVWIFAAALKTASTDLSRKLLFYKLEFLGSGFAPSLTLLIAVAFLGMDRWLTRRSVAVLGVVPLVGVGLLVVNPGNVMIVDPVIVRAQGIRVLEHSFPPLFALFLAWALGLPTVASVLLLAGASTGRVPWKPAAVGAVVFRLPVVVVALKVGQIYPPGGKGINLTPAVNGLALALLTLAITRYRFLELRPLGRDRAVERMPGGYVLVGPDRTVLDANPVATRLLAGDAAGGIEGREIEALLPEYAAIRPTDSDPTNVSVDDRVLEIRVASLAEDRPTPGAVLLLQDVTDKRARARELERRNDQLERFASVVSHDLRTPLSVASGRLELGREAVEDEDGDLEATAAALDRMESLIEDLLTLAQQGRAIDDTEPVRLSTAVQDCWDGMAVGDATVTVESDCRFAADPERLTQLLENLFRNAVEHGGPGVAVRVGALPDGDGFYVADDGPGIPESDRAVVFEHGHSTRPDGTGFGLAIVEEIATAHDWTVGVTTSGDGGARFEIRDVDGLD